jgi:acetoin utilization deacetylase AcuC-like enzyme
MIGEAVREMSQVCEGRAVDMIGSGYNREILPHAWFALIAGLANFPVQIEEPLPLPEGFNEDFPYEETKGMIKEVRKVLKEYWPCL